jgi:HD superfamily phosphohydrolase YqeK
VLYCADYLEPGREFDKQFRAELAGRFPRDPSGVLREVARHRVSRVVSSNWPLPDPMVRFWNSLFARVSAASG